MVEQAITDRRSSSMTTLRVGYTPDSDDVFNFYAWEQGRLTFPALPPVKFERDHIISLNRGTLAGEFDVASVSSVIYPSIADDYAILSVGTSVGRGYGPVLVSKHFESIARLRGKRIAVGGFPTTGAVLAMFYCPGARLVEMPYNKIAEAIHSGDVDAGVMIHEELVFFPQLGLHKVACLGAMWMQETGLPIPVGLNVVRRSLGDELTAEIGRACLQSFDWGWNHLDETVAYAEQFGRGRARQFIEMFSNADTREMATDVRCALRLLLDRSASLGVVPKLDRLEIIHAQ